MKLGKATKTEEYSKYELFNHAFKMTLQHKSCLCELINGILSSFLPARVYHGEENGELVGIFETSDGLSVAVKIKDRFLSAKKLGALWHTDTWKEVRFTETGESLGSLFDTEMRNLNPLNIIHWWNNGFLFGKNLLNNHIIHALQATNLGKFEFTRKIMKEIEMRYAQSPVPKASPKTYSKIEKKMLKTLLSPYPQKQKAPEFSEVPRIPFFSLDEEFNFASLAPILIPSKFDFVSYMTT